MLHDNELELIVLERILYPLLYNSSLQPIDSQMPKINVKFHSFIVAVSAVVEALDSFALEAGD